MTSPSGLIGGAAGAAEIVANTEAVSASFMDQNVTKHFSHH
jgi:hypothetical protein